MKKLIIISLLTLLTVNVNYAHEPLYGLGPHVLFKGGVAPHFTLHYAPSILETEYAIGYGLTKNWTVIGEAPFSLINGNYTLERINLKQKYRFYSYFERGLSRQISAVSTVSLPIEPGNPTVINMGITGGQEALHWYWFFGATYAIKLGDSDLIPGNHLFYNATIGYRPMKTSYYKPDIVLFLEGIGKYQQGSVSNDEVIPQSGGHSWSVAPTLMLTYRNIALRGGLEFGLAKTGYLEKPDTNFKLILEWHL